MDARCAQLLSRLFTERVIWQTRKSSPRAAITLKNNSVAARGVEEIIGVVM